MASVQPLRVRPLIINNNHNHQTSTGFFRSNKNLLLVYSHSQKYWSQYSQKNAISCFAHRFPFLPHSNCPPLHPPPPLCSRFPLPRSPLPSLFPLSLHPFRSSLASMATPHAANDSAQPQPQPPQTKTVRVVIKGRVQGVFYRNWTIENATQLGLKGWVRNKRDGSVEALFSGSPDSVQEMEQRCRRGPPAAMVTGLQVFPSDEDPGTGFERKPTA